MSDDFVLATSVSEGSCKASWFRGRCQADWGSRGRIGSLAVLVESTELAVLVISELGISGIQALAYVLPAPKAN